MKFMQVQVSHILREGNQIADSLANWNIAHRSSRIFTSSADLPANSREADRFYVWSSLH